MTAPQASPQQVPKPGETRFHELDALRGLAAVTVMLHHFEIFWLPVVALPRWTTLFSPLVDGLEAVILFFLLSGFVLSIPLLRGKGQPYPVYLLRRTLRLYGPYLGALLLSVAGASYFHTSSPSEGPSGWTHPVTGGLVLHHVLFLGNYDSGQLNTAFWSLIQEMRISLVFPALFLLMRRLRPAPAIISVLLLSLLAYRLMGLGEPVGPWALTLFYMPIFMLGVTLARHTAEIAAWYSRQRLSIRALLGWGSFVLYTWGMHLASLFREEINLRKYPVDQWLVLAGAAGYLILAMNSAPIRSFLRRKIPQFLGRISYSLYLTHGTVLFVLARVLGRRIPLPFNLLIFVVLSLLAGTLFCFAVEEPFLRVSRKVGARTRRLAGMAVAP